ncbi:reverse transcriptase family protein [Mucilaginibacter sp. R-33]|uniref:reverse transcriptase family protein n=1 Tax=Mucilaginibacter sp. R-33 TaxID=3416711 RepID=UPI003CE86B0A
MKESFYSWNEYSFKFSKKAQDANIPRNVILELLSYSKKLYDKGVPVIYDLKHLSFLTGYRESYLLRAISKPKNFYRVFKIPKKNGHSREITEPLPGLKAIQYWILGNIIGVVPPNKFNNAYSKGRSIVSNAKYHTKQKQVLNIDIEKYFDNIKYEAVRDLFLNFGYNSNVSNILASLCTLNGSLPQGSPSSPYLSSILTHNLDIELFSFCREWGLRYADDITISGNFHSGTIIGGVRKILERHKFKMNESKTRVKRQHQRQMVTGIVVNRKLSVKKTEIKDIRQTMFYINKYGLDSHVEKIQLSKGNYLEYLIGRVNFCLFVKKKNTELTLYKEQLIKLMKSTDLTN